MAEKRSNELNMKQKNNVWGWDLKAEWTEAVNVLRRHAKKKPFPIPMPNDTRTNER